MPMSREKVYRLITIICAEILASAILLYIGCMGCVDNYEHFKPTHFTICFVFGLAIMVSINTFSCVSGSHITPAITLAAVIYKIVDIPVSIFLFKLFGF